MRLMRERRRSHPEHLLDAMSHTLAGLVVIDVLVRGQETCQAHTSTRCWRGRALNAAGDLCGIAYNRRGPLRSGDGVCGEGAGQGRNGSHGPFSVALPAGYTGSNHVGQVDRTRRLQVVDDEFVVELEVIARVDGGSERVVRWQ